MYFSKGDSFTIDGKKIEVLDFLGAGGQGEVYLVSDGNDKYAFKYYTCEVSSDFKYNLRNNILKGAPSKNFLWPKEFVEFSDGTCGYLMDVRSKDYVSFVSYLSGKSKFKSQKMLVNWCIELVKSFKELHEMGYSYQDLNDGSFFINLENGNILICDNDNVTANKRNLGVLGKMRYMAPEIVRGDTDPQTKDRQMPDVHSDRFSLAVILFMTLCLGDPFEGNCLKKYVIVDEDAEMEMYGTNPVYVYSNLDNSNRPIRGYHTALLKRYPHLPVYIKEAFHRTFVEGLKDRENKRVPEIEWLKLLCKYRDELITCSCGMEYIYGFDEKKQNISCPHCKAPTRKFCYMKIGKSKVLLEPNKCLFKIHIDKYSSEYNYKIGKVIVNKNNPQIWGIKLALEEEVLIKDKDGVEKTISKDGVIPIINNLKIKFDDSVVAQIFVSE